MDARRFNILATIAILAAFNTMTFGVESKPLKIFILAGQSNMQGQAQVRTIARLNMTDDSKQMYSDMMVKDGLPSAPEGAYGVYFTGDDIGRSGPRERSENKGPLRPGFGEEMTEGTKFGPTYTFGIYMQKHLNEPILVVKIAWGGRSLMYDFRSPSAGKADKDKSKFGNPIGHYYTTIIKRVNEVLADPGKYHPAYNKANGCEIAGFVWFQGFNDMIGSYPSKDGAKDFSEYTRLMACFIRDIRKDLKTPQMPFVIGAIGLGGPSENEKDSQFQLRKAQMATAELPEFKGNVAGVRTEHCYDMKLKELQNKIDEAARKEAEAQNPGAKARTISKAMWKLKKTVATKVLTEEEQNFMKVATSNQGYHYMGSAYIYGKIGKAFADEMAKMLK